jgi:two-component system, cell cycle sensor histidine kinase and response regulator CckA
VAVLVVDDQDIVRDVIRIALEGAGYAVLDASTPSAALELMRARPDEIELVVTDVLMPEMNAMELSAHIERELPGTRVLFTSGYGDADISGPFIQKPFTPAELIAKVGAVIDG